MSARAEPRFTRDVDIAVSVPTDDAAEHLVFRLGQAGFTVIAAHPSPEAVDYREIDYTQPTALLLGAERRGQSAAGLALAHRHAVVPMHGHVRSLNVSVAAAVVLFEAARQRTAAGLYDRRRLADELYRNTLFEWGHPGVAAWCKRHGEPYPALADDGSIATPLANLRPRA